MIIGVDTGGTFTDVVCLEGGRIRTYKLSSTPDDFSRAVLEGTRILSGAAKRPASFALVHSTTVATNAMLERKGARTALIATKGFGDVLEIGRQTRPQLYNLKTRRPEPLIPKSLRKEVSERVDHEGCILTALNLSEVGKLADKLASMNVESVAVCLLFSFLNPKHEKQIGRILKKRGLSVSLSSEISPEFREYERMSTTVTSAYVSPVMSRYLKNLTTGSRKIGADTLRIVQSNGGMLSARAAGQQAVHTLMSGPAAGVMGAIDMARHALQSNKEDLRIITFDMGGTSTDVSLVDGSSRITTEAKVGGFPVRVPMIDIHTVGAGGGSLVSLDAGGALTVGPDSSGADPGPACYGKGDKPTVTDANLLLGRLDAHRFLGGRMLLDLARADRSMILIANKLGTDVKRLARAVLAVVNSNMERAIRVISVERGLDPKDYTLFSFGGAGGLHACDLATSLGVKRVMIPVHPGVLSAWGAVTSDVVKDYSRTVMLHAGAKQTLPMENYFTGLERQARKDLEMEGFSKSEMVFTRLVDLRYKGQSHELTVPHEKNQAEMEKEFHAAHDKMYGHCAMEQPVEVVTIRLRATGRLTKPEPVKIKAGGVSSKKAVLEKKKDLTIYDRSLFKARNRFIGPALVLEDYSTTYIPEGWRGRVDVYGNLMLEQGS